MNKKRIRVSDFPRPPRWEREEREIVVVLGGKDIARSRRSVKVLETYHPPVYYIPPEDVDESLLRPSGTTTHCEWKGVASYWDILTPEGRFLEAVAWYYPNPRGGYEVLTDHLAFYPAPMDACLVGGEKVVPQPGNFYGGWITSDLVGPFKGAPDFRIS